MDIENWLPVVGYEGFYEVSDLGRVRSLTRSITQKKRSGKTYIRSVGGNILGGHVATGGYNYFRMSPDGKSKSAHSMVAEAFIGPRPNGHDIDHLDNNRLNNKRNNLEYVTRRENLIRGQMCKLNPNKSSRYPNVRWNHQCRKWSAARGIKIDGQHKTVHVGYYDIEEEAYVAIRFKTDDELKKMLLDRRANMNIYQTKSGSWYCIVSKGAVRKESRVFKTKALAAAERDRLRIEINA
jgi:hypothetical protein